jgi:hypothetical protein
MSTLTELAASSSWSIACTSAQASRAGVAAHPSNAYRLLVAEPTFAPNASGKSAVLGSLFSCPQYGFLNNFHFFASRIKTIADLFFHNPLKINEISNGSSIALLFAPVIHRQGEDGQPARPEWVPGTSHRQ